MRPTTDQVNYLNLGLMIVSCVLAYIIPFELFLFSYAVLGPLHYLTEISWLHDRKYFVEAKRARDRRAQTRLVDISGRDPGRDVVWLDSRKSSEAECDADLG